MSKAIRLQRLPLDAAGASLLARLYPPLADVNIFKLTDAGSQLAKTIWSSLPKFKPFDKEVVALNRTKKSRYIFNKFLYSSKSIQATMHEHLC